MENFLNKFEKLSNEKKLEIITTQLIKLNSKINMVNSIVSSSPNYIDNEKDVSKIYLERKQKGEDDYEISIKTINSILEALANYNYNVVDIINENNKLTELNDELSAKLSEIIEENGANIFQTKITNFKERK